MDLFFVLVGILLIVLVLLREKGVLVSNDKCFKIYRKKDKELYKAFFYKRHKKHYPDLESLERACEESWKEMCEKRLK